MRFKLSLQFLLASLGFCAVGVFASFVDAQLNGTLPHPRPLSVWRMVALGMGFIGTLCLLNGIAHAVATLITRFVIGKKHL